MNNTVNPAKPASLSHKISLALYGLAAALMPSILLFDLYNRNHEENHIVFAHVLMLAGAFAIVGLLLFGIFRLTAGSVEGAMLLCILFWLSFWLFENLLGVAIRFSAAISPIGLMALIGVGLFLLSLIFRRYEPPFEKTLSAFNILAVSLVAMFFINLAPGINHAMMLASGRAEMADFDVRGGSRPYYIKRSFEIDPLLPSPDIYWFHMDGMLRLSTMESFFGINQDALRDELVQRGFMIYEDGFLHAATTTYAFPALFSPAFYDSFYGEVLSEVSGMLKGEAASHIRRRFRGVGICSTELMGFHELFAAFHAAGYEMVGLSGRWRLEMVHDLFVYEYRQTARSIFIHNFLISDLPELLNMTTPLSLPPPDTAERIRLLDYDAPSFDYDLQLLSSYDAQPSFTVRMFMDTHSGRWRRHEPNPSERAPEGSLYYRYDLYPLAFESAVTSMMNTIDAVLYRNQNAVIVLQSDHGFHDNRTVHFLVDKGYPMETVLELQGAVFSAVRIPPQYGGLDSPIAPLNISRELVNRFVGENYSLLQ